MDRRFRVLILAGGILIAGAALITLLQRGLSPSPSETAPPPAGLTARIRVEVLNGSGVSGVAWDATELLRDRGFDVVYYGNAETYSDDSSVVMDRVGTLEHARRVADALGISTVQSVPDSTLFVDVTVRLGPDWTRPSSGGEEARTGSGSRVPRRLSTRDDRLEKKPSIGPR